MDWCGRHGSHKYEKIEPHDHYFTYLGNMDWCGRHGSHKYEKIEPHDHYFTYLGNMDWCGRHGSHKYEKIEPHDPLNGPVKSQQNKPFGNDNLIFLRNIAEND